MTRGRARTKGSGAAWLAACRSNLSSLWLTRRAFFHAGDAIAYLCDSFHDRAMIKSLVVAGLGVLVLPTLAGAGPAPPALYGKSVIVAWSEARIQRDVGQPNFHQVNASHNLSVYVSGAGRVFNRLTNSTRAGTGSTEQLAGEKGSNRVLSFSGRSMTVFAPFQSGGMRHIVVEFDARFGSCGAKITYAKPPGTTQSSGFSPITKRYFELQSIAASGAGCSVRDGNVFGGS